MDIHPHVRALRADDGPQRHAQAAMRAAMAAWRAGPHGAALLADLAGFGEGQSLEDLPVLSACFAENDDTADLVVKSLVSAQIQALHRSPLGHVAMRHFTDGTQSTLLIGQSRSAVLTLAAIDGTRPRPMPVSVALSPNAFHDRVLMGGARAELITAEPVSHDAMRLMAHPLRLGPGSVIRRDGCRQSLVLGEIQGVLVTLRLQRGQANGEPTREFALADGRLLGQAAATIQSSRIELAAALLGRMGRSDAAPFLAAIAEQSGDPALRWQVLRECLALDTASGFAALCTVAEDPSDPLAPNAGTLRAQLIESHPVLAELARCRR